MKNIQKGFTLIELMIVVAIIGILAAVAIPAYQDYTVKSKATEGTSLATPAMTSMGVNCSEGVMTATSADYNASLGVSAATSISGKYVSSVLAKVTTAQTASVDGVGMITVTFNTTAIPSIAGACYTYVGTCKAGAGLTWAVAINNSAGTACGGLAFPAKFLPKL